MHAVPAAALGEALSWNRSSQPNSADGEGIARPRPRRQRILRERRSARDSKSRSIARSIAEQPLSRSRLSMSSTQSPPDRLPKNHRQHHLDIEPALVAGRANMPPDRRAEAARLDQVEIERKTAQRRQSTARRIGLILEIEQPLRQHR